LVDEEKLVISAPEQPDEPAQTEAQPGQPANAAPEDKAAFAAEKPKRSGLGTFFGLLILLSVLVLLAGGWYLWQELRSRQDGLGGQMSTKDQELRTMGQQLIALQSEVAALHSQLATVQSETGTQKAEFERVLGDHARQMNERLDVIRNDLDARIGAIREQLNRTRGYMALADAEYLLSTANLKLHLMGDIKSVIAALEAADQRLKDSGDPFAETQVRPDLLAEIETLRKLDAPDVVGLSSKLLALESKVKNTPLLLPHAGITQEHAPRSEGPAADDEGTDDGLLGEFKDLVKLRRTDRPVGEILSPEQAAALRQVLLLKLETARAALLRGDEAIYQGSLASARDWLRENFDTATAETGDMIRDIEALMAQPIRIPFPDIGRSLERLRNIELERLKAAKTPGAVPAAKPAPEPPAPPAGEETTEPGVQP
jgi:uncharacterized protein HemX